MRIVLLIRFKPSSKKYGPFQGGAFLCILFVICVLYVSIVLSCPFLAVVSDLLGLQPFGHLLGKGWPLDSFVCDVFLCFCHLLFLSPSGSGVVFDCNDC